MKSDTNYELLLSSISHELRNPVTLIQSYLQLLSAAHPEVKRYEYWDTIMEEVQHLCRLLEDLSAFHNGLRTRPQELDFGLWLSDYAHKAAVFLRRMPVSRITYTIAEPESGTAYAAVAETPAYDSDFPNDPSALSAYIPEISETTPEFSVFSPVSPELSFEHQVSIPVSAKSSFEHQVSIPVSAKSSFEHQVPIPVSAKSSFEQPGIRFSCRIAPDLPSLSVDPDKLRQVLDNLIRNAAEAHANQITLSACQESDQIILEIYDNGDGITPENLPQLFTPFVSHKPDGTGLGLAIAERIIKAHRGTITVHSVPHYLTVFRISLPVMNHSPQ